MYLKEQIVVNRRYQRKLVWSLEEKEKFIDSLVNGYPIPLILTSKQKDSERLEILDGLQRLNAITSFLECEFSLNGEFFDLDSITLTKQLKSQGIVKQRTPVLDSDKCSTILNYEIPLSTTISKNNDFIDETFRRINTGGRTLSKQDLRQAGSLGQIPEIINQISTYIRKDSSRTDIVTLKNIKSISIGNSGLNYGIDIDSIFWVKNKIILRDDIRKSRDEELIAYMLSYILLPKSSETSATYLDKIYIQDSNENKLLTVEINKYTKDFIVRSFNHIFDELNKIFKNDRSSFSDTIYNGKFIKSSSSFQVVFLSLYELIINEGKKINNYKNLHNDLSLIYEKHYSSILGSDKKWRNSDRTKLIQATKGLISNHFSKKENDKFQPGGWIKNLENIINESRTEQQFYDYKAGLLTISPLQNKLNFGLIDKILKTLTAMTNSNKGECMVIVGISETKDGAINHQNTFSKSYIEYNNLFIVGVEEEAKHIYKSLDNYLKAIKDYIENSDKISQSFKNTILLNLVNFSYKEKEILMFRAERGKAPEAYDKQYHTRYLSHNNDIEIGSQEMVDLFANFNS
ncbi:GmrSD restriction endonuclease domain-containing protein [Acinetobacter seifertii]|uniref:GmrSD restriction endonuclease domain-containing protein n=1 Tax=Acinetobacter seifertii TaxID=1530123 RepID=UPI0032B3F10F